jgi:FlaA1/EpsC-like NDP-sugar epimerase
LITGTLAVIGMGGVRLLLRLSQERATSAEVETAGGAMKRVLMVGAGSAGAHMARQLRRHPRTGMTAVGFLDDDPGLSRLKIGGLPVLGRIDDLPSVVRSARIDQVLITMPSTPGSVTRRVVELARGAGVPCRILPGVTQILAGEVSVAEIRPVQVEDLLRRDLFELDFSGDSDYLSGHVVLVTGAGGSIGAELVRQVARQGPKRVILFGRGENSLHAIEQELATELPDLERLTVVGSVTDEIKVREVLRSHAPDVVFHAAAHKHVPMMEHHPDEAVLNNVGGTRTIAVASAAAGVRRFVNISSDKAVNPVSMVGVTKSIAERVVRAVAEEAESDQVFVSVRFGNVLGSRGSVVPIFQEQIRRGGPITLTHPDMTRYFMTIPEASRLVIQAGALGANGAVFVLDMGDPVLISDLAADMIRLSGAEEGEIEIVYTGLRPGEKLSEELLTERERTIATSFAQIMMAQTDYHEDPAFRETVAALVGAAERRDWDEMRRCLDVLQPGFGFDAQPMTADPSVR